MIKVFWYNVVKFREIFGGVVGVVDGDLRDGFVLYDSFWVIFYFLVELSCGEFFGGGGVGC